MSEEEGDRDSFNHTSKFQPGEILYAVAMNDRDQIPTQLRAWPNYSREQMEALVRIARLLVENYGLEIVGHEEIEPFKTIHLEFFFLQHRKPMSRPATYFKDPICFQILDQ